MEESIQGSMRKIVNLDQSQKKQLNIQATPLFQSGFSCSISEGRCPIKKENKEQKLQLSIKDSDIYAKQRELENLRTEIGDKAISKLENKDIEKLLEKITKSAAIKQAESNIESYKNQIQEMQSTLDDRDEIIKKLQIDLDDFNKTVLEADLHQRKKLLEYRQLTKQCNNLIIRIPEKEKTLSTLERSIHEKKSYDDRLTVAINEKVDSIKSMDQELAKKMIENQQYKKVKPTTTKYGKQNIFKRLIRKIFKRRKQS